MNVILASSDHLFPYKLSQIPFEEKHFTEFIVFSELSPTASYKLLTEKWKVGKHLAFALVSIYGGIVWDHFRALHRLSGLQEKFNLNDIYPCIVSSYLKQALNLDGTENEKQRMGKTLRDLAIKGFSSIPDEIDALTDKFSIFLNEKNIDGVVASNFIVPLLPELVWNGKQVSLLSFRSFHCSLETRNRFALLPTTQSMRLLIAELLSENS
jgi:hypothetical protein